MSVARVPARPLFDAQLSIGARLLWAVLCAHASDDDICTQPLVSLADDMGCSYATLNRYVRELKDAKHVYRLQGGALRLCRSDTVSPVRHERTKDKYQSLTSETGNFPVTPGMRVEAALQREGASIFLSEVHKQRLSHRDDLTDAEIDAAIAKTAARGYNTRGSIAYLVRVLAEPDAPRRRQPLPQPRRPLYTGMR